MKAEELLIKEQELLKEIRLGAAKDMLPYAFFIFGATAVVFVIVVFLFPLLFGMGAGATEVLKIASICILGFVIFVNPVIFYLVGYSSPKRQRIFLRQEVRKESKIVDAYKRSLAGIARKEASLNKLEQEYQKRVEAGDDFDYEEWEESFINTCEEFVSSMYGGARNEDFAATIDVLEEDVINAVGKAVKGGREQNIVSDSVIKASFDSLRKIFAEYKSSASEKMTGSGATLADLYIKLKIVS